MTALAWLIPLLPFLAFGLIVFFGRRLPGQGAYVAIGALLAAAVFSLLLFFRLLGGAAPIHSTINWLVLGQQPLALGIQVDALTAVMLLGVSVVGSMIFIYSVGYMHGDPRYPRFFAYLSLFAASMLLLVLADNFLFLYVGWELVGLCSYFLLGFRLEPVESGDSCGGLLTAIALLLFGGAIGKSAQVPLHVWLPDAMEGPTPVSALIHAATMVTAGVYLVVRSHVLFEASEVALAVVLVIGLVSAIYAALASIGQFDIKRALAYSTMSQIGFMFFAAGMRFYAGAMLLLVCHAFYKALLFLTAANVPDAAPDPNHPR